MTVKRRRPQKPVSIGQITVKERALLDRLKRIQKSVKDWMIRRDIWYDSSFATPFLHRNLPPNPCEALYLITEGPLCTALGLGFGSDEINHEGELTEVLQPYGFTFDLVNHYTFCFYPIEEELQHEYLVLDRWRWVQQLAAKRMLELHTEIFAHFAERPDDLKRFSWRQYEEFLNAVFRNQGFFTELGPGSGDGGIDIRLYQSMAIPELVTVVQARRYRNRPIALEAVAALFGHAVQQGARNGIFATTSRFLPSAQKFALSTQQRVNFPAVSLANSSKVSGWCAEIASHLRRYYTTGESAAPHPVVTSAKTGLTGRIVVADVGYNCQLN